MAPRISKEVMNGYREQFKVFDINGDGLITRMELRRIMGALGHPIKDREVAVIWKEVDKNADGVIDFNEFVEFMERARPKLNGHNQMRDLFKMFDKKGTGLVSIKELELAMTSLGEDVTTKEVRDMLQEADRDSDGKVNFREFEQLFKDSLQTL